MIVILLIVLQRKCAITSFSVLILNQPSLVVKEWPVLSEAKVCYFPDWRNVLLKFKMIACNPLHGDDNNDTVTRSVIEI